MKRWLIACLVILLAGVSLVALARRSGEALAQKPFDEILAYELSSGQDVVLSIPGKVERLSVTSWAVVPRLDRYDPAASYGYALGVTASDGQGKQLFRRDYFQASRVSAPIIARDRETEFVTRLAEGSDWVADPRTTDVDLTALGERGGRVRLTSAGPSKARMLVRVAFSERRGELERRVVARSLAPPKRRLIVGDRASLGFGDLPKAAQQRALASWGRRVGALGSKGVDYIEQRLLLGTLRAGSQPKQDVKLGIEIDSRHAAALNLDGPVTLHLMTDQDAELELSEGAAASRRLRLPRGSGVATELTGNGPRTVKIKSTAAPVRARFQLSETQRAQQIGDFVVQAARDGKVEVGPDLRRQRYFRLHPQEPIRVHLPHGQTMIGLTLRGICQPDEPERRARVVARWKERGISHSAEAEVTLMRSEFDRFPDVGDASDATWLQFQAPTSADEVELTGPIDLATSVWTREPLASANVIHPAYARPLAEHDVFRHAPYDLRSWASLVPDNAEVLVLAGRELWVAVQVRIQSRALAAASGPLPEKALPPVGFPLRRELLMPTTLGAGAALPPATWTPIRGPTPLRIAAEGAEAARLSVRYRLGAQPLGGTLSLLVDGHPVHEQPLLLESGMFERPVPPGIHVVSLDGLHSGSEAYARAAPAKGGAVVKSYSVFELRRDGVLKFEVDQKAGEVLKLILFVVTEGSHRPFELSYTVDGGDLSRRSGAFYRQKTEASGTLQGLTGAPDFGHLWEALPSRGVVANSDGVGRAELRLGDDLNAGRRVLTIRSRAEPASRRVFLRAVLVGQSQKADAGEFGLWSAEPF
ncbi:MAG TPA: hypothetical protein VJN18_13215 [Polyangiaceae bacterium]|nr:hypothetical protein [Polyangiaceae bacterium]